MTCKVLVVDDEPLARLRLIKLLAQLPELDCVGEAESAEVALAKIQSEAVDICLLDIHMPGLSGIELVSQLSTLARPPQIIFCTAYEEHALEAFGVNAADYLLKPVRLPRLKQALDKAQALAMAAHTIPAQDDILVLPCGSDTLRLHWRDIQAFIAEDKYVVVVTEQDRHLTSVTLKQLEADHQERVLRAHRNALVVVDKVVRLHRKQTSYVLELKALAEPLQVSRRHVQNVRKRLQGLL